MIRRIINKFNNWFSSLKVSIAEGCVEGCTLRELRQHFTGVIVVEPGNKLIFENVNFLNESCDKPNVFIKVIGSRNTVVFRGNIYGLHPHLEVGGENNVVDIGSGFRVDAKGMIWYWFGKNNSLVVGENAWFAYNPHVWEGFNRISLGGEDCSIKLGNNFKGNITVSSQTHKSAYRWHFSCGENCFLTGVTLDAASSCSVLLGNGVFASWDFYIWCGAHAIFDSEGNLLNNCKGVEIGDNVWIGHGVEIPGAVRIAGNCVIGGHVHLVSDVPEKGSVVSVPKAKVLPAGISWKKESPIMVQRQQVFTGKWRGESDCQDRWRARGG